MGKIWVKLNAPKQIDRAGKKRRYEPGDWVDVGEQLAKQWLNDGSAWIPPQRVQELIHDDCGVVIWGGRRATQHLDKVPVTHTEDPELAYEFTALWDPALPFRAEMAPVGFALLDVWQVACPLWDYKELAVRAGNEEDRERTKAIIRDLRVPMYDTRLMWLRRCGDTQRLIDAWNAERNGGDDRLAFLRALYQVKPMILALPITWAGKRGPERP